MKPKVKPRKKKQTQSTNWVFTLNNYTDEEVDFLGTLYMDPHPFPLNESKVVAVAMSEEIAPTTGTPHLQGYLQLTKKGMKICLIFKERELSTNDSLT